MKACSLDSKLVNALLIFSALKELLIKQDFFPNRDALLATHMTLPSPLLSSKPFSLPITELGIYMLYPIPYFIPITLYFVSHFR